MSETTKFVELVAANPELPIVAYVNGDICHDYGMYWMGKFTSASVCDVGLVGERMYDERADFMEAYYNKYADELDEKFGGDSYDSEVRAKAEKLIDEYLEKIADEYMKKCIVVYVDEPDMSEWKEA